MTCSKFWQTTDVPFAPNADEDVTDATHAYPQGCSQKLWITLGHDEEGDAYAVQTAIPRSTK